jgi:hypothetical protein
VLTLVWVLCVCYQAKKAVGSIDGTDLAEIRSLKTPPEAIHDVLSAVLQMLGIGDTSWNSMKTFLGNRRVKEQILSFDGRSITPAIRKEVMKILKNKANSFEKEVRAVCVVMVVLCCALPCCAVLCCAVLCCAVLCCAVLCCAVLCCASCHAAVLM